MQGSSPEAGHAVRVLRVTRNAVENGNGDEQRFHSREKAPDLPQLVITYG